MILIENYQRLSFLVLLIGHVNGILFENSYTQNAIIEDFSNGHHSDSVDIHDPFSDP